MAEDAATKTRAEGSTIWLADIGGKDSKIHTCHYAVLVHGVKKEMFNNERQQQAKDTILHDNPNLQRFQFEWVFWRASALRHKEKKSGSVLVELGSPHQANQLIRNSLVLENELKKVELFDPKCLVSHCFKCQGYGHHAKFCNKPVKCGRCEARDHTRVHCLIKENGPECRCANCGQGHEAGNEKCKKQVEEKKRIEGAKANCAELYFVPEGAESLPLLPETMPIYVVPPSNTSKRTHQSECSPAAPEPPVTSTKKRSRPTFVEQAQRQIGSSQRVIQFSSPACSQDAISTELTIQNTPDQQEDTPMGNPLSEC